MNVAILILCEFLNQSISVIKAQFMKEYIIYKQGSSWIMNDNGYLSTIPCGYNASKEEVLEYLEYVLSQDGGDFEITIAE